MLRVSLFGKLDIRNSETDFTTCGSLKSQELFAFLLLHRDRMHAREKVASLLWGHQCTTAQSKKYLRNALWQLQAALSDHPELEEQALLSVEPDWIQLNSLSVLQLDVHTFEAAYTAVEGISGHALGPDRAEQVDRALQLYRGELLENWYTDWCLYERERMLHIYLMLLDKMMGYCEAHGQFEKALSYGQRILWYDRARECTHRRLMRIHYLNGDRSTALRQYSRCVAALREELDVAPSQRTTSLHEQIRADRWEVALDDLPDPSMEDVLRSLQSLREGLAQIRQRVLQTEQSVGAAIRNQ